MTDSVVVEGHVKLRDGKKVRAPLCPFGSATRRARAGGLRPTPPPREGNRALSSLPRPWLTLSFCLSLQWKSRWLVLRKPSPVAGKSGAGRRGPRAWECGGGRETGGRGASPQPAEGVRGAGKGRKALYGAPRRVRCCKGRPLGWSFPRAVVALSFFQIKQ